MDILITKLKVNLDKICSFPAVTAVRLVQVRTVTEYFDYKENYPQLKSINIQPSDIIAYEYRKTTRSKDTVKCIALRSHPHIFYQERSRLGDEFVSIDYMISAYGEYIDKWDEYINNWEKNMKFENTHKLSDGNLIITSQLTRLRSILFSTLRRTTSDDANMTPSTSIMSEFLDRSGVYLNNVRHTHVAPEPVKRKIIAGVLVTDDNYKWSLNTEIAPLVLTVEYESINCICATTYENDAEVMYSSIGNGIFINNVCPEKSTKVAIDLNHVMSQAVYGGAPAGSDLFKLQQYITRHAELFTGVASTAYAMFMTMSFTPTQHVEEPISKEPDIVNTTDPTNTITSPAQVVLCIPYNTVENGKFHCPDLLLKPLNILKFNKRQTNTNIGDGVVSRSKPATVDIYTHNNGYDYTTNDDIVFHALSNDESSQPLKLINLEYIAYRILSGNVGEISYPVSLIHKQISEYHELVSQIPSCVYMKQLLTTATMNDADARASIYVDRRLSSFTVGNQSQQSEYFRAKYTEILQLIDGIVRTSRLPQSVPQHSLEQLLQIRELFNSDIDYIPSQNIIPCLVHIRIKLERAISDTRGLVKKFGNAVTKAYAEEQNRDHRPWYNKVPIGTVSHMQMHPWIAKFTNRESSFDNIAVTSYTVLYDHLNSFFQSGRTTSRIVEFTLGGDISIDNLRHCLIWSHTPDVTKHLGECNKIKTVLINLLQYGYTIRMEAAIVFKPLGSSLEHKLIIRR